MIGSKVRIIPYNIHPSENVCVRIELKGCRYEGNFFNRLMRDVNAGQQSYLTSFHQSGLDGGIGALIGVLTTIIILTALVGTAVFFRRHKSDFAHSLRNSISSLFESSEQANISRASFDGRSITNGIHLTAHMSTVSSVTSGSDILEIQPDYSQNRSDVSESMEDLESRSSSMTFEQGFTFDTEDEQNTMPSREIRIKRGDMTLDSLDAFAAAERYNLH